MTDNLGYGFLSRVQGLHIIAFTDHSAIINMLRLADTVKQPRLETTSALCEYWISSVRFEPDVRHKASKDNEYGEVEEALHHSSSLAVPTLLPNGGACKEAAATLHVDMRREKEHKVRITARLNNIRQSTDSIHGWTQTDGAADDDNAYGMGYMKLCKGNKWNVSTRTSNIDRPGSGVALPASGDSEWSSAAAW